ncbi:gamma-aminobutyric acid receptor subunit beta-like [Argopecten irradians]|uniref:gamma-aminobutyric acid receptor subunit beta-like n=1 Tax=Argopecten irradians TaxID=31199 RepID=UPI00371D1A26
MFGRAKFVGRGKPEYQEKHRRPAVSTWQLPHFEFATQRWRARGQMSRHLNHSATAAPNATDYTITIYLNQYWADDRLAFARYKHGTPMTLTGDFAEKIWVPDTFFANDKNSFLHEVTEKNKMIRLYGNGSVVYGMRFTTTLACMMDLHNYPLDVQNCTVEIESYGYDSHDLYPHWRNGKESVQGVDKVQLPQFDIVEYKTIEKVESLSTGDYPRLSLSFKLHRNVGYFIFQTYLPSILIVMLSWVSFWINHEATSARVALGITTVLTMTTISNGVRSSLPRISYVKAIDIYLVMCFVFVFAALLEYAAVNYTFWGARAKKKTKKFKDGLITLQQPVEDEPDVVDEKPIETEEVQMSPIVAIRNSQGTKITIEEEHLETPPNIPDLPRTCMSRGYLHDDLVRRKHNTTVNKKKKYYASIRPKFRKCKVKFPRVKDVNNIDRYSRLLFPLLFLLFNVCYWGFYLF